MKLKNDNHFLDILIHYPENIKVENIIKEAIKIDSIINPDKGFNLNDNIEEQKVETSKYNDTENKKEKK